MPKPRGRPRKEVPVHDDRGSTSKHPPVPESHDQKLFPLSEPNDGGSVSKHPPVLESHAEDLVPVVVVKRLLEDEVTATVGFPESCPPDGTDLLLCSSDKHQSSDGLRDVDENNQFGEH